MIKRYFLSAGIVFVLAAIFLFSCSGKVSSPVIPENSNPTGHRISADTQNSRVLWGIWDISIDTNSGTVEAVPVRGVEFRANVTMFLQPPTGSLANLKFENLDLDDYFSDGLIELDVGLTHPFPGLDMYTGFDVLGVFMSDGSNVASYDSGTTWPLEYTDPILLNSDGYTRWFNMIEFPQQGILGYTPGAVGTQGFEPGATLNGFKYFADDLGEFDSIAEFFSTTDNCDNRGCFRPGSTNKRHYSLRFPIDGGMPVLQYQYGVFAGWEPALGEEPGYPISDFPMSANMGEGLILSASSDDSTLYYVDGSTYGGSLVLDLEILDHQGAVNVSGVTAEIAGITVCGTEPLVPGGYQEFDQAYLESVAQPGGPSSSVYTIDIPDCEPSSAGDKEILVAVFSTDPSDYDSGIPGFPWPDGVPLAAYALTYANVTDSPPDLPPVGGELGLSWDCPDDPCSGHPFNMEISEAYDPDGEPVTITWDFDGDMDYTDDMDGDDTNLSAEYVYEFAGNYDCWCRIDDGSSHTDIGPFAIVVVDCTPYSPSVVKEVPVDSGWVSYDTTINVEDGYAYVAVSTGADGKLWVVDIDPVEDAAKVGEATWDYLQHTVAHKSTYCYIGGVYLNGISTVDCSDPSSPVIVNTYQQGLSNAMINELRVVNDYLYAAAQWGGIMVFDITDPSSPEFVGQTPGGFGTVINSNCVAVTDDNEWGFYTDGYETNPEHIDYVKAVDLSDPTNPTVENSLEVHFHFYSDMEIQGNYLYLSESGYFTVIDISNLPDMEIVYTGTALGGNYYDSIIAGSYLYRVKGIFGNGTLQVIDIADPENPTSLLTMPINGGGMGVREYCGELYIAACYNTLDIVELY